MAPSDHSDALEQPNKICQWNHDILGHVTTSDHSPSPSHARDLRSHVTNHSGEVTSALKPVTGPQEPTTSFWLCVVVSRLLLGPRSLFMVFYATIFSRYSFFFFFFLFSLLIMFSCFQLQGKYTYTRRYVLSKRC